MDVYEHFGWPVAPRESRKRPHVFEGNTRETRRIAPDAAALHFAPSYPRTVSTREDQHRKR
eukprot:1569554-Pleurochrysis_carterae.AAC.1